MPLGVLLALLGLLDLVDGPSALPSDPDRAHPPASSSLDARRTDLSTCPPRRRRSPR